MSPSRPGAAVLVVAALAAALLSGCSEEESSPVRVGEAVLGTVAEVVEAPGTVTALATATVTSPATGTVATLAVGDGDQVQAGDVLATIDSPQALAQLEQAREADAEAAQAGRVPVPSSDMSEEQEQARAAARQGFAEARAAAEQIADPGAREQALSVLRQSEAQYELSVAQADALVEQVQAGIGSVATAVGQLAQAQRLQTRAAVAAAQSVVDSLTITSPIAGTVSLGGDGSAAPAGPSLPPELQDSARQLLGEGAGALAGGGAGPQLNAPVAVGRPVSAGTPLLTVTDTSVLSVVADVDETDVLLVQPGTPAEVELDAVPGATYPATVGALDPAPTTSGQGSVGYRARMVLGAGSDADGEAAPPPLPGMSAIVRLAVRTAEGVVAVPAAAVVRDGSSEAVYVVEGVGPDQVVRRRPVRTGAQGADRIEVTSGLEAGQRVVIAGADSVTDGQPLP